MDCYAPSLPNTIGRRFSFAGLCRDCDVDQSMRHLLELLLFQSSLSAGSIAEQRLFSDNFSSIFISMELYISKEKKSLKTV